MLTQGCREELSQLFAPVVDRTPPKSVGCREAPVERSEHQGMRYRGSNRTCHSADNTDNDTRGRLRRLGLSQ